MDAEVLREALAVLPHHDLAQGAFCHFASEEIDLGLELVGLGLQVVDLGLQVVDLGLEVLDLGLEAFEAFDLGLQVVNLGLDGVKPSNQTGKEVNDIGNLRARRVKPGMTTDLYRWLLGRIAVVAVSTPLALGPVACVNELRRDPAASRPRAVTSRAGGIDRLCG